MLQLIHISEGLRMFKRSLMISAKGYKRYEGSAEQILRQIIDNCWNEKKEYFQVSKGNYTNFYCRDFGIVTIPLIELGYKDKVIKTLEYAMNCYYIVAHCTLRYMKVQLRHQQLLKCVQIAPCFLNSS